jgi:hypothetical protein
MVSIEHAISKAYYDDEDGFGSMNKTLTDAKRYNEKVSLENVKEWFAKNIGVKRNLRGYNSFIADRCYEEYQMDLFFFQDLEKESGQKQPSALLMVDISANTAWWCQPRPNSPTMSLKQSKSASKSTKPSPRASTQTKKVLLFPTKCSLISGARRSAISSHEDTRQVLDSVQDPYFFSIVPPAEATLLINTF